MRWVEMIKVQSATGKEQITEHELRVLGRNVLRNSAFQELEESMVSRHATVPGCFALWLFWDSNVPQSKGSLLGMNLTQNLKSLGLVDFSVWIEAGKKQGGKDRVE